MDGLPYFKFNVLDWIKGKVQLLSNEEKGIFIELCARIWCESGKLKNDDILHRLIRVEKAKFLLALKAFCELGILEEKDGYLSVKFLETQIIIGFQFIEKQRKNGAKGGRPQNPNKAHKKRVEEKRVEETRLEEKRGEEKEESLPRPFEDPELEDFFQRWVALHPNMHPFRIDENRAEVLRISPKWRVHSVKLAIKGQWGQIYDKTPSDKTPVDTEDPWDYENKDYSL